MSRRTHDEFAPCSQTFIPWSYTDVRHASVRRAGHLRTNARRHDASGKVRMTMRALFRCGELAVALLALASCAGQQTALKPTDRTAVVRATSWGKVYRGGYVEIASVNGEEPSWRLRSEMELPAGEQTAVFYVYLCNGDMRDCTSIAQAQIRFRAEPRHTYRARAREQINGSNRFWVWVEDEIDGKTVGGTPPSPGSAAPAHTFHLPHSERFIQSS
jgi:hypothetical protein